MEKYIQSGKAYILAEAVKDLSKSEFETMFKHLHPTVVADLWVKLQEWKKSGVNSEKDTSYVRPNKASGSERRGAQSQSDNGDSRSGSGSD